MKPHTPDDPDIRPIVRSKYASCKTCVYRKTPPTPIAAGLTDPGNCWNKYNCGVDNGTELNGQRIIWTNTNTRLDVLKARLGVTDEAKN